MNLNIYQTPTMNQVGTLKVYQNLESIKKEKVMRRLDISRIETNAVDFQKAKDKEGHTYPNGIFASWSSPDIGFGEYEIIKYPGHNWKIHSEYMDSNDDKDFGKAVLTSLVNKAILTHAHIKKGGIEMKKDIDFEDLKITDVEIYEDPEDQEEGTIIYWNHPTFGEGQYQFYKKLNDKSAEWKIDSEFIDDNDNKQFGKELLIKFLDMCEVVD